jgi:broad specificity phosphatase PhoE
MFGWLWWQCARRVRQIPVLAAIGAAAVRSDEMKTIVLVRHTSNDGDVLTPEGVADAVAIGRRLDGEFSLAVSSGAQRATQAVACMLAGLGEQVSGGVVVVERLRSGVEDRWREAYRTAGAGDLESLRAADPELVATDSATLAGGLRTIFSMLHDGGRALAVGHSPTNEAAVDGLTGIVIAAMGKGESVTIVEDGGAFSVLAGE